MRSSNIIIVFCNNQIPVYFAITGNNAEAEHTLFI